MAIIGVGVDIVSVQRFSDACLRTPGLLTRVLTEAEIAGRSQQSLAARFAAKEAVAKALGSPGTMSWHDCVVVNASSGKPVLELTGSVLRVAEELGVTKWDLSLSHDGGLAIAFVVASHS